MKKFISLLLIFAPCISAAPTPQDEYWLCSFHSDNVRIGNLELSFMDGEGTATFTGKDSSVESAQGTAMKSEVGFDFQLTGDQTGQQESYECEHIGPIPYSILYACTQDAAITCRRLR